MQVELETIEFQHCHQCVIMTVGSVVNNTLTSVLNSIVYSSTCIKCIPMCSVDLGGSLASALGTGSYGNIG